VSEIRQRPEPVGKALKTALDETRTLILGAQILLGFGFRSVFQRGYDALPESHRRLDGLSLLLMIVTVALLIAPDPYHRLAEEGRDTERLLRLVTRMANSALLPFALALGITLFTALSRAVGQRYGAPAAAVAVVLALAAWYGAGLMRRELGNKETTMAKRAHPTEVSTPVAQRIAEMLTEARVILPGVQALLGFQLAIIVTDAFDRLPEESKVVHAGSLCCMALAVVLLMAPAAYHRIAFDGADTEEMYRVGSQLVTAATVPLALGLAGDVDVVFAKIAESSAIGIAAASIVLALLIGLWHVFPLFMRYRHADSPRRRHDRDPSPLGTEP